MLRKLLGLAVMCEVFDVVVAVVRQSFVIKVKVDNFIKYYNLKGKSICIYVKS
jgi:hypothetical protein